MHCDELCTDVPPTMMRGEVTGFDCDLFSFNLDYSHADSCAMNSLVTFIFSDFVDLIDCYNLYEPCLLFSSNSFWTTTRKPNGS